MNNQDIYINLLNILSKEDIKVDEPMKKQAQPTGIYYQ